MMGMDTESYWGHFPFPCCNAEGVSMGTTRLAWVYAAQTGAGELAGQTLCRTVQCGM